MSKSTRQPLPRTFAVIRIGPSQYQVKRPEGELHHVNLRATDQCDCGAYTWKTVSCIHIRAAQTLEGTETTHAQVTL